MKKRDVWISVAIIAASLLLLYSYSQGTGQIKIDAGGALATLQLHSGLLSKATISSGAEPSTVSSRVHRPVQLSMSMKQNGNTWRIDSRGPWGKLSTIKVSNNNTTVLKLGPPFLIKPKVRKSGSRISVDFAIIGQAGEQYQNYRRSSAPKVKIIDETGNVLASGKFEYG
ncbi:MAG: hypothetical protein ACETWQ_13375 [Phycisphaerae bacterium]